MEHKLTLKELRRSPFLAYLGKHGIHVPAMESTRGNLGSDGDLYTFM